ncbi:MAG: hypothetical protein IKF99_03935 [Oscillospiraceae bacterium]|nr:hypothetical protein [Oscillospiraceae bacterium]
MKTAKEYVERMRGDKAFAAQMNEKVKALLDAGEKDAFSAVSKAAKELGYEISPEQVREINKPNEDVSEEELGKLAGGTSCIALTVVVSVTASVASGGMVVVSVDAGTTFD